AATHVGSFPACGIHDDCWLRKLPRACALTAVSDNTGCTAADRGTSGNHEASKKSYRDLSNLGRVSSRAVFAEELRLRGGRHRKSNRPARRFADRSAWH